MFITTTRLKTRLIPIAVLALLAAGCTGETARQASPENNAAPATNSSDSPPPATNGADPPPLTQAEMRWIHAVEQLQPAMNRVFTESPDEMTPAALTALAKGLGGCRRELARIGPASARLQPVQALVEQACKEYDKGAACSAAAARVGIPSSTAAATTVEKQLKCAFGSSDTGGRRLAEAQIKAMDIKNAAG